MGKEINGFEPRNGRGVQRGDKVKVYRNLTRGGYSIVSAKTGLVLGYAEHVELIGARFMVQEKGRQRVLRERQKNVHAYVLGTLESVGKPVTAAGMSRATYNPYERGEFYDVETGEPVYESGRVVLQPDGRVWYRR